MWGVASSSAALTAGFADIGTLIALTVAVVIAAWAALVGLGFGKRKATHYVTGRKF